VTDREAMYHAALVALLREIDTRCVKDDASVRLVAIDEALIASVKSVMGESDGR